MHRNPTIIFLTGLICFPLVFTSCVNTRDATYFNDLNDTSLLSLTIISESVIQKNDYKRKWLFRVTINVFGLT